MRVYELARELGISSAELLRFFQNYREDIIGYEIDAGEYGAQYHDGWIPNNANNNVNHMVEDFARKNYGKIEKKPKLNNRIDWGGIFAGVYGADEHVTGYVKSNFKATSQPKGGVGHQAERANHFEDVIRGKKATILGDDNSKNGPDRVVDGQYIQTKYYSNASATARSAFESNGGNYKYIAPDGKPMQLEVPKDQYLEVLDIVENKIRDGKVPGTNPDKAHEEATKLVRKGYYTHKQVQNIAKAGNIDSLIFDAKNGATYGAIAGGISFLITYALSIWNGEDNEDAVRNAVYSGIKAGSITFVTTIITSQISKTEIYKLSAREFDKFIEKNLSKSAKKALDKLLSDGGGLYGNAVSKTTTSKLGAEVVTTSLYIIVVMAPDIVNIFRGRISMKQLFKDLGITVSTVAGGKVGSKIGGKIGRGVGRFLTKNEVGAKAGEEVGKVIGGTIGALFAADGSKKLLDGFFTDDAIDMIEIIEAVLVEKLEDTLLTQKEIENITDEIGSELDKYVLMDMFQSDDREVFAGEIIDRVIEDELNKRKVISFPPVDLTTKVFNEALEKIYNGEDISDIGVLDLNKGTVYFEDTEEFEQILKQLEEYKDEFYKEHKKQLKKNYKRYSGDGLTKLNPNYYDNNSFDYDSEEDAEEECKDRIEEALGDIASELLSEVESAVEDYQDVLQEMEDILEEAIDGFVDIYNDFISLLEESNANNKLILEFKKFPEDLRNQVDEIVSNEDILKDAEKEIMKFEKSADAYMIWTEYEEEDDYYAYNLEDALDNIYDDAEEILSDVIDRIENNLDSDDVLNEKIDEIFEEIDSKIEEIREITEE